MPQDERLLIGSMQGLNAAQEFLQQFNYPSSGLLGTINAIYELGFSPVRIRFCPAVQVR